MLGSRMESTIPLSSLWKSCWGKALWRHCKLILRFPRSHRLNKIKCLQIFVVRGSSQPRNFCLQCQAWNIGNFDIGRSWRRLCQRLCSGQKLWCGHKRRRCGNQWCNLWQLNHSHPWVGSILADPTPLCMASMATFHQTSNPSAYRQWLSLDCNYNQTFLSFKESLQGIWFCTWLWAGVVSLAAGQET